MAHGEIDLSDQVFIKLGLLARASKMTRTRAFRYYLRLGALRQLPGVLGVWYTTPPLLQQAIPETWALVVAKILEQRERYEGSTALPTREYQKVIGTDRTCAANGLPICKGSARQK